MHVKQMAPSPPGGMLMSKPASIIKAFVKPREVTGDVACLDLGRKGYDYRGFIQLSAINFSLMAEDEQEAVIEGFKAFLNGLSFPIQILIRNLPYNLQDYLRFLDSIEGELAEMAHDHAAFVRHLASKRALVKRLFYVIVPADRTTSRNRTEALINAQTQIKLRIDELLRQLERLGLSGHRMSSEEINTLFRNCLTPNDERQRPLSSALLEGVDRLMTSGALPEQLSEAEYLALLQGKSEMPSLADQRWQGKGKNTWGQQFKESNPVPDLVRLPELLAPASIQVFPTHLRIDGEAGQEYVRALAFVNYPRAASPGWFDHILQIDEPSVDFSIHITPLEPTQVQARLGRKAIEFRGSMLVAERQGKTAQPGTAIALRDVEHLREELASGNERVFSLAAFVLVRANNRQTLSERSNRLQTAIRSLDFRALPTHWQHHLGLLACLPYSDNPIGRGRLFGTSAAATWYPFTGADPSMESGVMFGVLPNGGLVLINPFKSDELENANMVVFAKSGAGKSFFLKTVCSRLLPMCNVYVIDPEKEYGSMCDRVHGHYVRLSSESLQLNPLELYGQHPGGTQSEDQNAGNFFREKLLNLITFFELLLSDNGKLLQREKSFLYRCLARTYELRGITVDPRTHVFPPPSMTDLYTVMTSASTSFDRFGVGRDEFGLSERLERYLHLFPKKTQVALEHRFVDFNIRELPDSLKPVGLFLVTEFLWMKLRQARQARIPQPHTIILIDEAWLLMQFEQSAKFLASFARRIRKYGGGLWCTTQHSDDFLNTEEGRTILVNSSLKFLMKQDATTIESVQRTFRLAPGQRSFLLGARRGEGLFSRNNWIAMEVAASTKEAEMANTTIGSYLPPAPAPPLLLPAQVQERQKSRAEIEEMPFPFEVIVPRKELLALPSFSQEHQKREQRVPDMRGKGGLGSLNEEGRSRV
jgi:hypothetical protein